MGLAESRRAPGRKPGTRRPGGAPGRVSRAGRDVAGRPHLGTRRRRALGTGDGTDQVGEGPPYAGTPLTRCLKRFKTAYNIGRRWPSGPCGRLRPSESGSAAGPPSAGSTSAVNPLRTRSCSSAYATVVGLRRRRLKRNGNRAGPGASLARHERTRDSGRWH